MGSGIFKGKGGGRNSWPSRKRVVGGGGGELIEEDV